MARDELARSSGTHSLLISLKPNAAALSSRRTTCLVHCRRCRQRHCSCASTSVAPLVPALRRCAAAGFVLRALALAAALLPLPLPCYAAAAALAVAALLVLLLPRRRCCCTRLIPALGRCDGAGDGNRAFAPEQPSTIFTSWNRSLCVSPSLFFSRSVGVADAHERAGWRAAAAAPPRRGKGLTMAISRRDQPYVHACISAPRPRARRDSIRGRLAGGRRTALRRPPRPDKQKILEPFSIYACHPCAGAMLIFSVSFQFYQMPEGVSAGAQVGYESEANAAELPAKRLQQWQHGRSSSQAILMYVYIILLRLCLETCSGGL